MTSTGLRTALDLTELGAGLLAQRYRREHPDAGPDDVREAVKRWMLDRSKAPDGDSAGRKVV